jgi:hypothetical protein
VSPFQSPVKHICVLSLVKYIRDRNRDPGLKSQSHKVTYIDTQTPKETKTGDHPKVGDSGTVTGTDPPKGNL